MINHTRTLLLNTAAGQNIGDHAEYIDPTFGPLAYPAWMLGIATTLFPEELSLTQRNIRAAGCMQLLHQSELLPYTLLYDTRFTYAVTGTSYIETADEQARLDVPDMLQRLARVGQLNGVEAMLFQTQDIQADELAQLRTLWYQTTDAVLRCGAFMLAFMIQAERLRRYGNLSTGTSSIVRVR
jgi:hypothetical protein